MPRVRCLLLAVALGLQGCVTVGFATAPVHEQPCDPRLVGQWTSAAMDLRIDAACVAHVAGRSTLPPVTAQLHVGQWQTPGARHALVWLTWGKAIDAVRVVWSGQTPPPPELQKLDQLEAEIRPVQPSDFYLLSYRIENERLYLEAANGEGFASAVSAGLMSGTLDKPAGATGSARITAPLPTRGEGLGNFQWFDRNEEGMERVRN